MPDDDKQLMFWLKAGDVPTGPFTVTEIHAKLAAGEVPWDTPACPLGGGIWLPLHRTPGVGPGEVPPLGPSELVVLQPAAVDPAPAPAPTEPTPPAVPRVWNPAVIAGLSILFTPMWGGILGAMNAGRLGLSGRWWPPVVAGFGYMAVSFVPELLVKYPAYWVELVLYLAGVGVLWGWGLAGQTIAFAEKVGPTAPSTAGWVLPAVLGSPLALLAVGAFVIVPLLPHEPREVCDRFVESSYAWEAKGYATANLHPAIDAMFKQKQEDSGELAFELTDEAPASPEVGGYLVGYRLVMTEKGKTERLEGVFHLVDFGQGWKVEDWLVTVVDGQQIEQAISFARDYHRMFQPNIPPASTQPKTRTTAAAKPADGSAADAEKSWWERNKQWVRLAGGAAFVLTMGGGWAGSRKSPVEGKS